MRAMGLRSWLSRLRPLPGVPRGATPADEAAGFPALEQKLGHRFQDPELLRTALTHRSHVYRSGRERLHSNERLEFLGDSVLGLIVNEHLFRSFPERSEGEWRDLLVVGKSRSLDCGR